MDDGKINEAKLIVDNLETESKLSPDDQITLKLLKSHVSMITGDYKTCFRLTEEVIKESVKRKNYIRALKAILIKTYALTGLGEIEEASNVLIQGEKLLLDITEESSKVIKKYQAALLRLRGRIFNLKGEYYIALEFWEKALKLFQEIKDDNGIATLMMGLGLIHGRKNEIDQALKYHRKALKIYQEKGNNYRSALCYINISGYLSKKGEFEQALLNSQKSFTLAQELGNPTLISYVLTYICEIYENMGELAQAIEYARQILEINKKEIGKWQQMNSLEIIASLYMRKGELDQALEYSQQRLTLAQELGHKPIAAHAFNDLGFIYWQKGDWEQALSNMEMGIESFREQGLESDERCIWMLFRLISFTVERNLIEKAKVNLACLKYLNDHLKNRLLDQTYRTAEALVLKASPEVEDHEKAQVIFRQIIEEKSIHFSLSELAMISLCELFLEQVRYTKTVIMKRAYRDVMEIEPKIPIAIEATTSEPNLLEEVKTLVTKVYMSAQNKRSFSSAINALVLQAKLRIIEGDLSSAAQLLDQALLTALENNLEVLADKVTAEIEELKAQQKTWKELIETGAPYKARLEQVQIAEYLKNYKQTVLMHKEPPY